MGRPQLTFQHACLWAVPTACYGLLAGAAEAARTQGAHWTDVVSAAMWSGGIMLPFGAAIGAVSAVPVAIAAAVNGSSRPARWACLAQSLLIVLVGGWIYVNHQVMLKTSEAMTPGALAFLISNPKEVMDQAWRLAGYHLIAFGIATLVALVALAMWLVRLNGRLLVSSKRSGQLAQGAPNDPSGEGRKRPGGLGSVLMRCRPTHPVGIIMAILFTLPAILLVAQFTRPPNPSLLAAARAFPPFRAIQMTRWLTAPVAQVETPPPRGAPVVDLKAFVDSCQVDRSRLRNVLIVLLESVPARALHCYGYARDASPHMDKLAAEGVQFDRCYAAASFSSYSQISVLTSLYMLRAETNDHYRDTSFHHVCLHEMLGQLGYERTVFSSGNEAWDNLESFYPPETFDVYFSHNHSDVHKTDCNRMDDKHAMGAFAKWLGSRRTKRPFFGYINLQGTHFNYEVPEPWASRYLPVPPLYSNGDGVIHIPADVLPKLKNQYDNALAYVDHWVGFIRKQLERAGELDRSIIVVVGDHGEGFMEHGLARHGMHLWNEMIHVPLIIFAPGLLQPKRIDEAVSQIDILPTVTSMMGLTPHPSWQGVNVLADDYDDRARPVFSVLQLTRYQEAVIWGHAKYITDLNLRQEWLFDLARDPGETRNLVGVPKHTHLLKQLRRMVAQWHSYQLAYYADKTRRRTHYIGMPAFPAAGK